MSNRDTAATLAYHEATKHSEWSAARAVTSLDWTTSRCPSRSTAISNRSRSRDFPERELPALAAIARARARRAGAAAERIPDLATLARVLYLSAGITKRKRHPGGEVFFRAYPNTGALYHMDLYVVAGELPDSRPACTTSVRTTSRCAGCGRATVARALLEASGENPDIARAPLVIASASTYWRNSWKYQARA